MNTIINLCVLNYKMDNNFYSLTVEIEARNKINKYSKSVKKI